MTTRLLTKLPNQTDQPGSADVAEPHDKTPWLLGFLCLLTPILPSYSVFPGPLRSNGSPARLIAVLMFGLVVLGFVVVRRKTPTRTLRPGAIIILFYFLLEFTLYAVGLTRPGSALVEGSRTRALIILVANVGVALYILLRIRTSRDRDFLLGCIATGLAFACLVGWLQSVTNIDLRYFFQPPGFVINADELELSERWGVRRVMGTSQHSIEFSVLASVTVPLMIYFARNATKGLLRWLAVLACVLALIALPAAVSRTGLLALSAALLAYMWGLKLRHLAVGVVVGLLGVGAYIQAFPNIANSMYNTIVNSAQDPSVLARTADYAAVSKTFRANPIFGLGLGGAPPTEYGYLDNQWLQAIVQGGAIGILTTIVLIGGGLFGFSAALRAAKTPRERDQAYALGAMFIAIAATSFTFDVMSFQQVARILVIVFALLWSSYTVSLTNQADGLRSGIPTQ